MIGFGAAAGARRACAMPTRPAGSDVVMTLDGREIAFRIGAPGRHWVGNALGVVACAAALGADPEGGGARSAGLQSAGRPRPAASAHRAGGPITLIDDSYNANPASVRAALQVLATRRRAPLAALGDMLELGDHAPRLHAGLAQAVVACGVDRVYTAGPAMRHLHDALPAARRGRTSPTRRRLLPILEAELRPGDTLLIKGSLGMRMGRIVEALLARGRAERRVAGRRR